MKHFIWSSILLSNNNIIWSDLYQENLRLKNLWCFITLLSLSVSNISTVFWCWSFKIIHENSSILKSHLKRNKSGNACLECRECSGEACSSLALRSGKKRLPRSNREAIDSALSKAGQPAAVSGSQFAHWLLPGCEVISLGQPVCSLAAARLWGRQYML